MDLLVIYSDDNKKKTRICAIFHPCFSTEHPIIKSTDNHLANGLKWVDDNGDKLTGVWEVDGVYYAMTQTFITTLSQVNMNKTEQLKNLARNLLRKIDEFDDNIDEQRANIKAILATQLEDLNKLSTIREVEKFPVEVNV